MLRFFFIVAVLVTSSIAATITYDWSISWVNAAPDGFERPLIGINGQWPCPYIEAIVGDLVVVNVQNNLGNETTSLHFHGITQKGTPEMDGPSSVTQCPIPPGSSFTYSFIADLPGTYWYHAHNAGQYPDGLRGPLIVRELPGADPYGGQYDEEIVLTATDWYHDQVPALLPQMLSASNPHAAPPLPAGGLLNDSGANATLYFEPGKSYKIRFISMAAISATFFQFDSHKMKVIEIDGVYVQAYEADQIRVAPAQRYSVIVTAKPTSAKNYAIAASMDTNRDYSLPGAVFLTNMTANIIYDSAKPLPGPYIVPSWVPLDDTALTPFDNAGLYQPVTKIITLDFNFGLDNLGIPRAYFNNITYVPQKVPTLYSVLTTGASAYNPVIYGQVNAFVVEAGQVVEIVLNNLDEAVHPFHLHGHAFQVLDRPKSGTGKYISGKGSNYAAAPARRDTVSVMGDSYVVLRFIADNPGIQLFHCHIEWHVEFGLTATIIEAPTLLQSTVKIPQSHLDVCKAQGIPTAGNAAGNTRNYTDLSGANTAMANPNYGALYSPQASSKRRVRRAGEVRRWT